MKKINNPIHKILTNPDNALNHKFGDVQSRAFIDIFMTDVWRRDWKRFDEHLGNYLRDNLKRIGFEFARDSEFKEFISTRISKVSFEENTNYHELYLDFVDDENRGQFIGSYDTTTTVSYEGDKVITTIGEPFTNPLYDSLHRND